FNNSYDNMEDVENDFRAFCTAQPSPLKGNIYAIFVGRKPGTYNSSFEVKEQVDGFPNNFLGDFKTREDAEKAVVEFASSSNQFVLNEIEDFSNIQLKI
ncbi:Hypothetical predicted protein, partial [Olea europaea subsp. europaea]